MMDFVRYGKPHTVQYRIELPVDKFRDTSSVELYECLGINRALHRVGIKLNSVPVDKESWCQELVEVLIDKHEHNIPLAGTIQTYNEFSWRYAFQCLEREITRIAMYEVSHPDAANERKNFYNLEVVQDFLNAVATGSDGSDDGYTLEVQNVCLLSYMETAEYLLQLKRDIRFKRCLRHISAANPPKPESFVKAYVGTGLFYSIRHLIAFSDVEYRGLKGEPAYAAVNELLPQNNYSESAIYSLAQAYSTVRPDTEYEYLRGSKDGVSYRYKIADGVYMSAIFDGIEPVPLMEPCAHTSHSEVDVSSSENELLAAFNTDSSAESKSVGLSPILELNDDLSRVGRCKQNYTVVYRCNCGDSTATYDTHADSEDAALLKFLKEQNSVTYKDVLSVLAW